MTLNKKNYLLTSLELTLYTLPLSFLIGSLIVNINVLIFIILGFYYLIKNKIKIDTNLTNLSLLLFFLFTILSSMMNIDIIGIENFYKSIFLIKYFFLFILIETLIYHRKVNIKILFNIFYFLAFFISLDLCLQFFSGENILGYKPWEGRITGIFEHEAVAGAYLQKVFLFSLISGFLITSKIKNKNIFLFFFISFLIIVFASFIASNRISFLIVISTLIFLIIFYRVFRMRLLAIFIILLPIFYSFYQSDDQINNRYQKFVNKIEKMSFFKIKKVTTGQAGIIVVKKEEPTLPNHGKIFLTSYKSFKDKMFFGNGLKSFRYNCKNYLKEKNTLCSTHSHNYHLEILHDTGIIGFIILSFFVLSLIFKKVKLLFSKELDSSQKIVLSLLLLNLLIELFPLKSTGSIFTTWNGTLLWLSISLINYKNTYESNKKF